MNSYLRLDECCQIELSSINKKSKPNEKSVKLCNFTDVYYNWNIYSSMIDEFMEATASDKNISAFLLKKGDVVVTKDSETRDDIGMAALVYEDLPNTVLGYHCALIRPKKNIDGTYLNAYLNSYLGRKHFRNQASGSGQRYTLTKESLGSIKIPIIPMAEQKKIGAFFSDIDKKIQNNIQTITNLESLAKTIYDYWFLQFEFPNEDGKPYKSSGGKMVWNDELKREIPEGWSIKKLSDVVEVIDNRGKNPPTASSNTRFPIIDVATLRKRGRCISYIDIKNYVTEDVYQTWFRAGHPQKGDILFSTVGSLAETKLFYPNRCYDGVIAQNIVGFRNKEIYSYLYQMINSEKKQIIGYKIGSVQPSLKVGHVLEHKFLYPNNNILNKYCDMLEPINGYINKLNQENHELETLRDFLLPMLMNGQVTFKEDE